jgi:hypothetical protein
MMLLCIICINTKLRDIHSCIQNDLKRMKKLNLFINQNITYGVATMYRFFAENVAIQNTIVATLTSLNLVKNQNDGLEPYLWSTENDKFAITYFFKRHIRNKIKIKKLRDNVVRNPIQVYIENYTLVGVLTPS